MGKDKINIKQQHPKLFVRRSEMDKLAVAGKLPLKWTSCIESALFPCL
jgi:hypothetical protein